MNDRISAYLEKLTDFAMEYGPRLAGAAIVLILGLWAVRAITRSAGKIMAQRGVDPSLAPFLKGLISTILKVLIIISVLGMIGIEMTSFIAIIAAAGLAVGMALSGTLQNFAGGVMILIFRPFNVGDFIQAQGFMGTVREIGIFRTILNTPDKKVVIIPNGPLATEALTNFSREPQRRVDWTFGIAYGDSVDDFKRAILDFAAEDERILQDPPVFIGLAELADSSVNFTVRAWVMAEHYWDVLFDMNEKVYRRFGDYDLNIPFPQMDVRVHREASVELS